MEYLKVLSNTTRATPMRHNTSVDFHIGRSQILVKLASSVFNKEFHLNKSKILKVIIFLKGKQQFFIGDLKLNRNISSIKYNLSFRKKIIHIYLYMFRPAEKYTQICEFFMIFSISLHNLILQA